MWVRKSIELVMSCFVGCALDVVCSVCSVCELCLCTMERVAQGTRHNCDPDYRLETDNPDQGFHGIGCACRIDFGMFSWYHNVWSPMLHCVTVDGGLNLWLQCGCIVTARLEQ